MKAKLLIIAAVLAALPFVYGCNSGSGNNNGSTKSSYSYFQYSSATDYSDSTEDENEVTVMYIIVNSIRLEVELEENSSVTALIEILKQNDITYTADDYGNFEKVGSIDYSLPTNDERITTQPGDVILYQGNNICLYYGTNTWSFTRIGKINGYSQEELKSILGAGDGSVQITISLN